MGGRADAKIGCPLGLRIRVTNAKLVSPIRSLRYCSLSWVLNLKLQAGSRRERSPDATLRASVRHTDARLFA
jgi:hypothetical protein